MSVTVIEPTEKSHMTEDEIRFQVNNLQIPQWIVDEYVSYPLYELKWNIYRIVKVANTHSFMFVYTEEKVEFLDPWEIVCELWPGQGWLRKMRIHVGFVSECGNGCNAQLQPTYPPHTPGEWFSNSRTCSCITGWCLSNKSTCHTTTAFNYISKSVSPPDLKPNSPIKEMLDSVMWRE